MTLGKGNLMQNASSYLTFPSRYKEYCDNKPHKQQEAELSCTSLAVSKALSWAVCTSVLVRAPISRLVGPFTVLMTSSSFCMVH